jgi:hypothetical protein
VSILAIVGVLGYEIRQSYLSYQKTKQTEKERKETLDKLDEYLEQMRREWEEHQRRFPNSQGNGQGNIYEQSPEIQTILLELRSKETYDEIKNFCNQIALAYHPDKNGGDMEKSKIFSIVSQDCTTLKNRKRSRS